LWEFGPSDIRLTPSGWCKPLQQLQNRSLQQIGFSTTSQTSDHLDQEFSAAEAATPSAVRQGQVSAAFRTIMQISSHDIYPFCNVETACSRFRRSIPVITFTIKRWLKVNTHDVSHRVNVRQVTEHKKMVWGRRRYMQRGLCGVFAGRRKGQRKRMRSKVIRRFSAG